MQANIFTADPTGVGGVQTHARTALRLLDELGFQSTVIYTRDIRGGGGTQVAEVDGHRAIALPRPAIPFAWTLSPLFHDSAWPPAEVTLAVTGSAHVAFPLALKREKFVIWLASLWRDELDTQVAGGDTHARRLLASPLWPVLEAQERFVLRRATRVVANSSHTYGRLLSHLPDIGARLVALPIPIDTDRFTLGMERERDDRTILLVGRLDDDRKNVPLAIRAFALALRAAPDLRLVLAGGGAPQSLQVLAAELGIAHRVRFAGRVAEEELRRLYREATLLLLTSRQEGLGLVVLEALASGTRVVSTRSGGPDAILEGHPEAGRLAASHEPDAVATSLLDALGEGPADRFAQGARAYVGDHHSLPAAARRLATILAEAFPNSLALRQGQRLSTQTGSG